MSHQEPLKAPFPWPGGKSKVADMVWDRLGNVDNYVEPFAGSLAVLLRRPAEHFVGGYRTETTNDADHFITNFWRSLTYAPDEVARWADWPVMEADLHARHRWLMRSEHSKEWRKKMAEDPDHYDAKIAGWWVWGLCCWIGSGWCAGDEKHAKRILIPDGGDGHGVHGRPQLTDAFDIGRGVNGGAAVLPQQRPHIGDTGRGVNARPQMGTCAARREWLTNWMRRLADRLRLVRTCYGHWSRICDSDSTMTRLGLTGVFLDPPYPLKTEKGTRAKGIYSNDSQDLDALRDEVLAWCQRWAGPQVRIAVCGYEGDGYEALEKQGWSVESWSTSGGYGNQSKSKKGKVENASRERIWFSPSCQRPASLFD